MPELEEVKTRLNFSRPFEELPTKNHYSHAQRDAGSVQVAHPRSPSYRHVSETFLTSRTVHLADTITVGVLLTVLYVCR